MNKKTIAAGHICIDITPKFPANDSGGIAQVLSPGKLVQVGEADVHTGGAVANTGLAMKFFGADIQLMGKIGCDAFGAMVLDILRQQGAADGMISAKDEATSYSVVLALPGVDRIFLHNPGANDTFCSSDVPQRALEEAALLHFGYPPLMKAMFQNGGEQLTGLFARAKEAHTATSLDMAMVDAESEAGKSDWQAILRNVLPYTDFFVPSAEELCFMLDKTRFGLWQARAAGKDVAEILDIEADVAPLARQCLKLGAKIVLVKCGSRGMYFCSSGSDCKAMADLCALLGLNEDGWADKAFFERSFTPDRIASGTGAGDTSIAAFLCAMLEGRSAEQSVALAAAAGASCVASYDALGSLLPLGKLQEKIDAGWKKC